MATFREACSNYCTNRGMDPNSASQVVSKLLESDLCPEYLATKFDRPTTDQPPQVLAVLNIALKDVALQWIEQNAPQAWYRPMFTEGDEE